MSLQDESFPSDELFEQLNNRGPRPKFSELHQPSAFERHPAPFCDSYTEAADKSGNTCVSDPVGREDEEKIENDVYDLRGGGGRNGRVSMATSCQDVHSAYTKRKYQHVTSKVAKYISDLNDQKKRRSTAGSSIQRHSSMPEYLTPKSRARHGGHFSVDELHQMHEEEEDEEVSPKASKDNSSSCVDYELLQNEHEMLRNENEAIREEKERLQSYSDYLQERLDAKQSQFVQLKRNFETLRIELSDKDEKLKRHQRQSLRALNNWPTAVISKTTQTDNVELKSILKSNNLAGPQHPSFDLSYNTSEGSIEMVLPTGESLVSPLNPGHETAEVRTTATAPINSSESSQPSSNDSAIEVENHGLRLGLYYVDERRNRFMQIQGVSMDNQGHARLRPKRISLSSRMLRIFGPCVSCSDHVQGQAMNVTYVSGQPLLEEEQQR